MEVLLFHLFMGILSTFLFLSAYLPFYRHSSYLCSPLLPPSPPSLQDPLFPLLCQNSHLSPAKKCKKAVEATFRFFPSPLAADLGTNLQDLSTKIAFLFIETVPLKIPFFPLPRMPPDALHASDAQYVRRTLCAYYIMPHMNV